MRARVRDQTCDTDAWGEAIPGREHAVRQVLDREIGAGIDRDEGAEGGIVGMHGFFGLGSYFPSPLVGEGGADKVRAG
jgi:hypothetical protein